MEPGEAKGQAPETQAADRAVLAEGIAFALARELHETSRTGAEVRRVTRGTVARESPRFNSRVLTTVKRGVIVELLAVRWGGI